MSAPSLSHSFHLTKQSDNRKTGPIPVSTSSADTCPVSCPLRKVCYAKHGPLALHWAEVTNGNRGGSFNEFLEQVRSLPAGQLWRHNEAGDLPGQGDDIDTDKLDALVAANRGRKGFTYTHYPVLDNPSNAAAIQNANQHGFTVNLSADSVQKADKLKALNVGPVAVVLPDNQRRPFKTPAGNHVAICPHTLDKTIKCRTCQLCQRVNRKAIIGFPVHGNGKKHFAAVS
jgi:hypothetical protein